MIGSPACFWAWAVGPSFTIPSWRVMRFSASAIAEIVSLSSFPVCWSCNVNISLSTDVGEEATCQTLVAAGTYRSDGVVFTSGQTLGVGSRSPGTRSGFAGYCLLAIKNGGYGTTCDGLTSMLLGLSSRTTLDRSWITGNLLLLGGDGGNGWTIESAGSHLCV